MSAERVECRLAAILAAHVAGYSRIRERAMTAAPGKPAEPNILDAVTSIIPKTVEISRNVIFGEIWERPGLSKRDRSLITVATLLAQGSDEQHVRGHLTRALQNGATKEEISELLTHVAFYIGWPAVMSAALLAKDVFEKD